MRRIGRLLEVYQNEFYRVPYLRRKSQKIESEWINGTVLTNVFAFIKTTCRTIIAIISIDSTTNWTRLENGRFFRITTKETFACFTGKYTEMITRTNIITYTTWFRFILRFYERKLNQLFERVQFTQWIIGIFAFFIRRCCRRSSIVQITFDCLFIDRSKWFRCSLIMILISCCCHSNIEIRWIIIRIGCRQILRC